MALLTSSQEQAAKMYQQLLNLVEEMVIQASEDDESLDETGFIQSLVEDAEERGLDEENIERVLRIVALMRKKAKEQ